MDKIRKWIKISYLAVLNLINMLRYKSRLIVVVVISISASVFGILFYSGYFLYSYYETVDGSIVVMEMEAQTEENAIWKLIEKMWNVETETEKIYLLPNEQDETELVGAYNRSWETGSFLLTGKNFLYGENTPSVIMAEYLVDLMEDGEVPIGKNIEFQGDVFKVVGIVSFTEYDTLFVPIKYFASQYNTKTIQYSYSEQLSNANKEKIKEIVENSNIVADYSIENNNNPFLSEDFMSVFFQILLIFMVVVMNAFSMTYYSVMLFKRNYRIYAVCGASKKDIRTIILIQNIVLIFISVIIGNLLYIICNSMIKGYGLVYQGNYMVYIEVSAIVFLALLVFAYLLAKKVVKTDVIYIAVE
mgnify:FL=1